VRHLPACCKTSVDLGIYSKAQAFSVVAALSSRCCACRYEINTEGDAFHVAFKDVQHAVLFCMEVQYQVCLQLGPCKHSGFAAACSCCDKAARLSVHQLPLGMAPFLDCCYTVVSCINSLLPLQMMELEWPREVLRLAPCREVKAPDGTLIYRSASCLLYSLALFVFLCWRVVSGECRPGPQTRQLLFKVFKA
jgi:hypothetical protein